MSKKFAAITSVAVMVCVGLYTAATHASGWANGYGDYYKHDRFENKDTSVVLGAEGGLDTRFADMYGFAEYDTTNETTFLKGQSHFKVLPKDFTIYTQASNFSTKDGSESVGVVGVGYNGLGGETWSFKPFLGQALKTGSFAGQDATMLGWSASWKPADVLFTNWHEFEFGTSEPVTINGGVGAWVDITKSLYTGVQYTYTYKTSGEMHYGNSVGWRIGYHF